MLTWKWAVAEQAMVPGSGCGPADTVSGPSKFLGTILLNVLSRVAFLEAFQVSTKQVLSLFSTAVRMQLFT